MAYPSGGVRLVLDCSQRSGVAQTEEQIARRRRDGDAVRAVAGRDGVTTRRPTHRRGEIVILLQRATARVRP